MQIDRPTRSTAACAQIQIPTCTGCIAGGQCNMTTCERDITTMTCHPRTRLDGDTPASIARPRSKQRRTTDTSSCACAACQQVNAATCRCIASTNSNRDAASSTTLRITST
jgi:hypothetical protein